MSVKNNNDFGAIRQLGYLVENIEVAVDAWMDSLHVGPWTIIKNVPLACTYLGRPSQPVIDIALSYRGDIQIELIQQINEEPSPYTSYFQQKKFGLHHTAYISDDISGTLQQAENLGHRIVCDINMPGSGRYVYTQVDALGEDVFIEFLEATPTMLKMFQQGVPAAAQWVRDPIREKNITLIDLSERS